jgi:uncharacterized low-complexity protein
VDVSGAQIVVGVAMVMVVVMTVAVAVVGRRRRSVAVMLVAQQKGAQQVNAEAKCGERIASSKAIATGWVRRSMLS